MAAASRRPGRGEFELLARVRAAVETIGHGRDVVVGIGDDAAVVRPTRSRSSSATDSAARGLQVLTTDAMVEGVHFRRSWLTPRELGRRAFRAAVSDVAAMGARPRHVLLSLEVPTNDADFGSGEVLSLVRAMASEARSVGATLVGGNLSGGRGIAIHTTVIGDALARPLLRNGARPGDLVFVTGRLGGASAGWRMLEAVADSVGRTTKAASWSGLAATPAALRTATVAYRRPPLRLELAEKLAAGRLVRSMIDVSDGLLQDLAHLAEASQVRIRVEASAVPIHPAAARMRRRAEQIPVLAGCATLNPLELALSGGEDYELAFTASPRHRAAILQVAAAAGTPVTVIGIVAKGAAAVTDHTDQPFAPGRRGFDHLRDDRARPNVGRASRTPRSSRPRGSKR